MNAFLRDKIKTVLSLLPTQPSKEALPEAKKLLSVDWLIYKSGYDIGFNGERLNKVACVHCTACESDFMMDRIKTEEGEVGFIDRDGNEIFSGAETNCPLCGAVCKAYHSSKIRGVKNMIDHCFLTFERSGKHLAMLSWVIFKQCDRYGNVSYEIKPYEGIVFVDGKPYRCVGFGRNMCNSSQFVFFKHWELRQGFSYENICWHSSEILRLNVSELSGSDLEKSGIEDYVKYLCSASEKSNLEFYLRFWNKYPCIENLVRAGYSKFVANVIRLSVNITTRYGWSYYSNKYSFDIKKAASFIDATKVKPHEIIGVEKEDMKLLEKYSFEQFMFYVKIYRTQGVRLSEDELNRCFSFVGGGFDKIFDKQYGNFVPPVIRTINYYSKISKKVFKKNSALQPSYLSDYWDMCADVYDGEIPDNIRYPKDLFKMHDRVMLLVKNKTNPEIDDKIRKYAEKKAYLNFADENLGLSIHVCPSQSFLIQEGNILNHCVGTYAKKVSEGETCILFIRKTNFPEMPYYTLEYRDGRIIQNHGKNNCSATPTVKKFEQRWLKYVNEKALGGKTNARIAVNG